MTDPDHTPKPAPSLVEIIRRHSAPLDPKPTEIESRIDPLPGIRAVLFDVYGTLIISGSGDIGAAGTEGRTEHLREAVRTVGVPNAIADVLEVDRLHATIRHHQTRDRESGVTYPEIVIPEVWRELLNEAAGETDTATGSFDDPAVIERLAIEYECRVNPVWPMPNCREALTAIHDAGFDLGIISNAQFFTPLLFAALLDRTVAELRFADDLVVYSYKYRQAKPGVFLYERAAEAIRSRGISPDEVLYIGNDMRNDVGPARRVGFRTVLFAGDQRSLRLREDDEALREVLPDRIVTDLSQLTTILGIK